MNSPAPIETALSVEGMHCSSCIRTISTALEDLDGVQSCEVQLRAGKVTVVHDPSVAVERLVSTLGEGGYPATVNG